MFGKKKMETERQKPQRVENTWHGLEDPQQSYYMSIKDDMAQEAREGWRGGGSHGSQEE